MSPQSFFTEITGLSFSGATQSGQWLARRKWSMRFTVQDPNNWIIHSCVLISVPSAKSVITKAAKKCIK